MRNNLSTKNDGVINSLLYLKELYIKIIILKALIK